MTLGGNLRPETLTSYSACAAPPSARSPAQQHGTVSARVGRRHQARLLISLTIRTEGFSMSAPILLIISALLGSAAASPARTVDITHSKLHYTDIADGRPASMDKGFVQTYVSKHGYEVTIGDRLELGSPTATASATTAIEGGSTVYPQAERTIPPRRRQHTAAGVDGLLCR